MLKAIGEDYDEIEVDLQNRDPELLKRSPTGKVPFLVEGDLTLYESTVINDYLAETRRWTDAYPADSGLKARHRVAMAQWDSTVTKSFYEAMKQGDEWPEKTREQVRKELGALAATVEATGPAAPCMLAFHVAPFYARMSWLSDLAPAAALIGEHPGLKAWLDAVLELPAVAATLPDREATVAAYQAYAQA